MNNHWENRENQRSDEHMQINISQTKMKIWLSQNNVDKMTKNIYELKKIERFCELWETCNRSVRTFTTMVNRQWTTDITLAYLATRTHNHHHNTWSSSCETVISSNVFFWHHQHINPLQHGVAAGVGNDECAAAASTANFPWGLQPALRPLSPFCQSPAVVPRVD